MTSQEVLFFDKNQNLFPIYAHLREKMEELYGDGIKIKVSKTQISFSKKHVFLVVSVFKKRLMVTIGLGEKSESQRVMQAVEAYPGRWTHHVIVENADDLDEEIMELIRQSYVFSEGK